MTARYARGISAHVPWEQAKGAPDEALKEPAPRRPVIYLCTRGHAFSVMFAAGADAPDAWDCRCGQPARREDAPEGAGDGFRLPAYPTAGAGRYERPRDGLSHRQFLAMRRTDAELEAALAEALDTLRQQREAS